MKSKTLAAIALTSLILTSCGSIQPTDFIGSWQLDVAGSSWAQSTGQPRSADLTFKPDGTISIEAVLPDKTETLSGTYGVDGERLVVTHGGEGATETQTLDCRLKGDTLTVANQHGVFLFRKEIPVPTAPAEPEPAEPEPAEKAQSDSE